MALNYYILPTNINNKLNIKSVTEPIRPPEIRPDNSNIYYNMALLNNIPPYISQSYCIYYAQLKTQLTNIIEKVDHDIIAPGAHTDIVVRTVVAAGLQQQLKEQSQLEALALRNARIDGTTFYDMVEVITTLNILSTFSNMAYIKAIHIGNKYTDNYQYLSYLRNNPLDKYFYFYENIGHDYSFHYIFYDLEQGSLGCDINDINIKNYTMQFVKAVMFALKSQVEGGVCIIKLTHLIHKPILDLVYILLSVYEKALIIKPTTVNTISHNKYLVCKGFTNKHASEYFTQLHQWLQMVMAAIDTTTISNAASLLSSVESLPLYFLNKITDINTILGHKQLEAIDALIYTLKSKTYHSSGVANKP